MMKQQPTAKAPVITLAANAGLGKTTLAGLFPNPVFIQAEDAETIFEEWENPPAFMPQLSAPSKRQGEMVGRPFTEAMDQLRWLMTNEHDRKTLVVDTVSALNRLFEQEICMEEDVSNIGEAAGGYGKGALVVLERHTKFRQACEHLRKKGMTIVFLSHVGIQKVKASPDTDEYMVYNLEMDAKSIPVYVNFSDAVYYIRKDEMVQGKETDKKGRVTKFGKMIDTGRRKIVTSSTGRVGYANAKSRYAAPEEIDLPHGENPILQYIPALRGYATKSEETQ